MEKTKMEKGLQQEMTTFATKMDYFNTINLLVKLSAA